MNPQRLAFVDLETTGANPVHDRITEIGVVTVADGVVSSWHSLVNPGCRIPDYIQRLTGIDNAMVADAPAFANLADEIERRLEGYTFIAHNARFDYGFLKNEFKRLGRRFQADVLCTVKLSRRLFPQHHRHNLDSLIERHGLRVQDRHRALGDADLIWQFWQMLIQALPPDALTAAIQHQLQRPSLPANLDAGVLDDLPDTPGVYLFYGEGDALLYVGKSVNLRQRVLSHFNADTRALRELRLGQETHRIEWHETVGELGALLLESRLIKERRPQHNRYLRGNDELCSWRLVEQAEGDFRPLLVAGADLDPEVGLFGLFASRREATLALRKIVEAHGLCPAILGLEKPLPRGRACFAYQVHKCRGACIGAESIGLHSARLMSALAKLKLKPWPYPGAVGIVERDEVSGRQEIHVVAGWRHLGTARCESDLPGIVENGAPSLSKDPVAFDRDIYRLLLKHMTGSIELVRLPEYHRGDDDSPPDK